MASYLYRVTVDAWAVTKADVGFTNARRSIIRIVWALLVVFVMWYLGFIDLLVGRLGDWMVGIIATTMLGVLLFVTNFVTAPARLDAKVQAELVALKAQLPKPTDTAALAALRRLRKEGVNLRNREIAGQHYPRWKEDYVAWRNAVLENAAILSPDLHSLLEVVDQHHGVSDDLITVSDEHYEEVAYMSEVLQRLQRFLGKQAL